MENISERTLMGFLQRLKVVERCVRYQWALTDQHGQLCCQISHTLLVTTSQPVVKVAGSVKRGPVGPAGDTTISYGGYNRVTQVE